MKKKQPGHYAPILPLPRFRGFHKHPLYFFQAPALFQLFLPHFCPPLVGLVLICCYLAPQIMIFYKLLGGRNLPPATSFWHGKDDKEESGSAEERVKPEDCSGSDGGSQPEEGLRHQKSRRPVGPEMERGVVHTRWQTFGRSIPTRR